jgi:hypothetical protein
MLLAVTAPPNKDTEVSVTFADLHVEPVEAAESKLSSDPEDG